ncbi:uncharacterized protein LOC108808358 [Raphanus sativus]|uniref:Uncharacterized protein LOC108808358 n=1 Tax=Raphanus sativus TaxID=3726 RepID=A0A9W3BVN8_RAPSA|nr:uncharacterized protein LOC108808358 [Raphanus sativus]
MTQPMRLPSGYSPIKKYVFTKVTQMISTTYYLMSLYQRWEEFYYCENAYKNNCEVVVNIQVEPVVVKIEGHEIEEKSGSMDENEVVWFEVADKRISLKNAVIMRMEREELNFGWKSDPQETVIERSSKFSGGDSNWKSYRCYVLVKSFVLKRRDESIVVTFEFRHVNKLNTKWEL